MVFRHHASGSAVLVMRTTTSRLLLVLGTALLLSGPLVARGPAASAEVQAATLDPGPVRLTERASPVAVFTVPLPPGGRLRPLRPDGEVLVVDAHGRTVGAHDAPWAADALGRPLRTTYRTDGARLIQTVKVGRLTPFPVTV